MSELMPWFAMHGYAVYVWPAYGLVFGVLIINVVSIRWRGKRTRQNLRTWLNRS
ncbi:MAG: heme exporter protein CcmD [Legionellaceae bacterium]|nr:heme exporter protein CcmD [Legionellaceae bacterium]